MTTQKKLLANGVSGLFAAALSLLSACQKPAAPTPEMATPPPAVQPPFKLAAGIKDIMKYEIDPAADTLWESVGKFVSKQGTEDRRPRTDEEWSQTRGRAIVLTEAANLIMMDGRRVAMEGHQLEDHGTPGNLTAEQSQEAIDKDRATFISFAHALHDVGADMLKAADAKDADALMEAGAVLDTVCEGCHLKFWYPGQRIPRFPDEAPEVDVSPAPTK